MTALELLGGVAKDLTQKANGAYVFKVLAAGSDHHVHCSCIEVIIKELYRPIGRIYSEREMGRSRFAKHINLSDPEYADKIFYAMDNYCIEANVILTE